MQQPETKTTATPSTGGQSVVLFTDAEGRRGVKALARLDEAFGFVEKLYNDHKVRSARVFLLHEIDIDLQAEAVAVPAARQPA